MGPQMKGVRSIIPSRTARGFFQLGEKHPTKHDHQLFHTTRTLWCSWYRRRWIFPYKVRIRNKHSLHPWILIKRCIVRYHIAKEIEVKQSLQYFFYYLMTLQIQYLEWERDWIVVKLKNYLNLHTSTLLVAQLNE